MCFLSKGFMNYIIKLHPQFTLSAGHCSDTVWPYQYGIDKLSIMTSSVEASN